MQLSLHREKFTPQLTLGTLLLEGHILCCTMERAVYSKTDDVHCIDARVYDVMLEWHHGARQWVPSLYVPGTRPVASMLPYHVGGVLRPHILLGMGPGTNGLTEGGIALNRVIAIIADQIPMNYITIGIVESNHEQTQAETEVPK